MGRGPAQGGNQAAPVRNVRSVENAAGTGDYMRWKKMKHHERRELVNTLTQIARDYGQTQQLRDRIAYALPFDCDVIDAPSVEDARRIGDAGWPTVESAEDISKKLK